MEENNFDAANQPEQRDIMIKSCKLFKKIIVELDKAEKLVHVRNDKFHPDKKIYYFEYDEEIEKVRQEFIAEKRESNGR